MQKVQKGSISDPELKHLLDLLAEYASKLRERSENWYSLRFKQSILLIFTVLSFLFPIGYFIFKIIEYRYIPAGLRAFDVEEIIFKLIIFFVAATTLLISYINYKNKMSIEKDSIFRLRIVLEKLVRRSSQMEDHGNIDFTTKLAFQLRLAEAEAALNQSAAAAKRAGYQVSSPSKESQDRSYVPVADKMGE